MVSCDFAMHRNITLNGGRETNAPIRLQPRAQYLLLVLISGSVETNVQRNFVTFGQSNSVEATCRPTISIIVFIHGRRVK